jgi:hypothetical protein
MMLGRRLVGAFAECEQKQLQGLLQHAHCSVCIEVTVADEELRLQGMHVLVNFRTNTI